MGSAPRALLATLVAVALLLAAPAAHAAPGVGPATAVSLGDSFISGEAGRWAGNSLTDLAGREGTDRAWTPTFWGGYYDTARVYLGGSHRNDCHRSDVAPIRSATLPVAERVNLACSGAVTANVWRASAGGQPRRGEAPQADQLAVVARSADVKLVVLSIGGNDLGFEQIIATCAALWTATQGQGGLRCADAQQALVERRLPTTLANVARTVDEVRAVMSAAGYDRSQYRFVLQSYPSPVPRGAENRYAQGSLARLTRGGCPFYDRDLDWARDDLVGQLSRSLRDVAAARGVQFLDLRNLLQGREVCARTASLVTLAAPPSPVRSEWVRFLTTGLGQGESQESLHPNAYGQQAQGRCLGLLLALTAPAYTCFNTPGADVSGVGLTPTASGNPTAVPAATAARAVERAWPARYPSRARR